MIHWKKKSWMLINITAINVFHVSECCSKTDFYISFNYAKYYITGCFRNVSAKQFNSVECSKCIVGLCSPVILRNFVSTLNFYF